MVESSALPDHREIHGSGPLWRWRDGFVEEVLMLGGFTQGEAPARKRGEAVLRKALAMH